MIKLIFTGKKGPEKTMEEFKKYYLEKHAPLTVKTCVNMRKYTVNFPIERPGKEPPPFDFIAEVWYDDIPAVQAFYRSDEYKNIIQPDEVKLGATAQAVYFEEFVQKA
ncbi:MAG TPA: EthD domain-containing protein [Phenylobacterium sp.]